MGMKRKRKYYADPGLLWKMVSKQKPFCEEDFIILSVALRMNLERLRIGEYDEGDHRSLCAAMNTCAIRSVSIGDDAGKIAHDAIMALAAIGKRHDTWGKWECIPAEEIALLNGVDLHDQMVKHSDKGSLVAAFSLQDVLAA
jgi:hypothetical protein